MKTVRLRDWGQVLGTRLLGEEIRRQAEVLLDQGEVVCLDFDGVEVASPSFVDELVGKLFLQRGQTTLRGRLRIVNARPETHALIRRMVAEREKERHATVLGEPKPGWTSPPPVHGNVPSHHLNPFEILSAVQEDYLTYVRTFQRFQNPEIREWVLERVQGGTLLWKPPYIQLSRPFAPGDPLSDLVAEGLLHSLIPTIFRRDPDDLSSPSVYPYRHQSEAIRRILGSDSPSPAAGRGGQGVRAGANAVVATGTGSGKSFCFGIPIVSECLRLRSQGVVGIKAVIVYPMNALANSQYDDFARRLHGSGLTIARYRLQPGRGTG